MRGILTLALLLLVAPLAHAQVQTPAPLAPATPAAQATAIPERSAGFEVVEPAQIEARQLLVEENAAAAALQPDRTSWWWLVGAIVVSGVILTVLLR